ncbi:hypothetical protein ACFZB9_16480 [Kitasatospora sp. NPDC008050]|uniref:hypothetical protein n=1 Tax=Kitasatospora sp. NPDC008050 TaxID=3364021 RepID=UPI0036E70D55
MTDIQVSVPIEPTDLPLPRPLAEAVLRGLLNGTAFTPMGAEQQRLWPVERDEDRDGVADGTGDEEALPVAERERTAPAHCRYAMQYLD